ncbi:Hypothetical protein MVR_LOCUS422 [uncultured virus]|nr:Hypothetical protein MVR_LOCUS422 [uncultured virus]
MKAVAALVAISTLGCMFAATYIETKRYNCDAERDGYEFIRLATTVLIGLANIAASGKLAYDNA